MSHSGNYLLVLILAFAKGRFSFAEETCPLRSSSLELCTATSFQGPQAEEVEAQAITSGSCDFAEGQCGYSQGCRQTEAPRWTHVTDGYFELKANGSGGFGQSSALESPLLKISSPSCLNFRAAIFNPVRLAVVLSSAHGNCTLMSWKTSSSGKETAFQGELPGGVAKIVFQGFGGGDTSGFARISSVSICPRRCNDTDVPSLIGDNSAYLNCDWDIVHWKWITKFGATLEPGNSFGSLTTPLITQNLGCISFEYYISNGGWASLSVSLVDTHGAAIPKWNISRNNDSNAGRVEFKKGQLSVASDAAFRIKFTAVRKQTDENFFITVRNLMYTKGNATACPFLPPHAKVINASPSRGANVAAVAGGVTSAVVAVVVAAAVGGVIFWRKRRRRTERNAVERKRERPCIVLINDRIAETAAGGRPPPSGNDYSQLRGMPPSGNDYSQLRGMPPSGNDYSQLRGMPPSAPPLESQRTDNDDTGYTLANNIGVESPNPESRDDYDHLGLKGRELSAAGNQTRRQNDYTHTGGGPQRTARRPDKHETLAGKETSDGDGGGSANANIKRSDEQEENEYHEIDLASDSELEEASGKVPENVSDFYDRLGETKGGNAGRRRAGEATPQQAYDRVVGISQQDDDYSATQRDRRNKIIDWDYNRLGDI